MDKPVINKITAADAVYKQLKDDIITLVFKPGEKLSETKLAERYNVSRDPIRKSVSRLVQEGMLESKPQVGTIVKGLSIKQGKDVCDLRLLIECYAVELAIANISDGILNKMIETYKQLSKILEIEDEENLRSRIYSLDSMLHNAIYEASGNSMIKETIDSYSPIIKRIQISNITYHKRTKDTMNEMHAIIIALKERDKEKAVIAMYNHIANIKATMELPI